ncbi:MAG: hypothetical protein ACREEE_18920 [Dongiaceae bacterium]
MLRWNVERRLAAFEREFGADMGYARDILAAGLTAFRRFAPTRKMADHNDGVPRDAFAAAKIVATLAYRFAQAVLARDIEADSYRAEIERRWGKKAVVSLALAIAGSRVYPTLKYALGHGQACARVRVGDGETVVRPIDSRSPGIA